MDKRVKFVTHLSFCTESAVFVKNGRLSAKRQVSDESAFCNDSSFLHWNQYFFYKIGNNLSVLHLLVLLDYLLQKGLEHVLVLLTLIKP